MSSCDCLHHQLLIVTGWIIRNLTCWHDLVPLPYYTDVHFAKFSCQASVLAKWLWSEQLRLSASSTTNVCTVLICRLFCEQSKNSCNGLYHQLLMSTLCSCVGYLQPLRERLQRFASSSTTGIHFALILRLLCRQNSHEYTQTSLQSSTTCTGLQSRLTRPGFHLTTFNSNKPVAR